MSYPDLKPCPFCGGEAVLWEAKWTSMPRVGCKNKNCIIHPQSPVEPPPEDEKTKFSVLEERIIEAWNTRI
ncbi:MAG: Lar family restriction alleviation protein [Proteobacteria bacterium]|jgi:hypothetical protein|nr:Lar family restriction alleviation protein [Pseudomonadota bacterium]